MFKVYVEGKESLFSSLQEMDIVLEEKGYKRIIGNCGEWCVGKLLSLENKKQFYICGTIRDSENQKIKAIT